MRLWVDADAAPKDVKDIVMRAAERLEIEAVLVANQRLFVAPGYRFVTSLRGHRVTWAIFNTTLLGASRDRGRTFFTAARAEALTKKDLRELVSSREDLVRDMAHFDDFYRRLIEAVPLKNVTSHFAMERVKYTTAYPVE